MILMLMKSTPICTVRVHHYELLVYLYDPMELLWPERRDETFLANQYLTDLIIFYIIIAVFGHIYSGSIENTLLN